MAELDSPINMSWSTWTNFEIDIYDGGNIRVNKEVEVNAITILALVASGLLILSVNLGVMYWMWYKQRTLIDVLMLIDCLVNILSYVGIFLEFPRNIFGNTVFCLFKLSYMFFVNTADRMVPVIIGVYRYILIRHRYGLSHMAQNFGDYCWPHGECSH